jgi:hypothetical protein
MSSATISGSLAAIPANFIHGFYLAKQGVGQLNGRSHKSVFPFFHD